jgi:hypothetical protein
MITFAEQMKPHHTTMKALAAIFFLALSANVTAEGLKTVVLRTFPNVLGGLAGTRKGGEEPEADSAAGNSEWQDGRMRSFFVECGVPFGEGSYVRYNAQTGHLAVRNTTENIQRIRRILQEHGLEPFNVAVTLSLYICQTESTSVGSGGKISLSDLTSKQPAMECRQVVSCSGNTAELTDTTATGAIWYHQVAEITPVVGVDLYHIDLNVFLQYGFLAQQERPKELPGRFTTRIVTLDGASFVLHTKAVPAEKMTYVWTGSVLLLDYDGYPYRNRNEAEANQ